MSGSDRLRAHMETWRPYTLLHPGLVSLAGAALAVDQPTESWRLVGAWAVPSIAWLGALYGGDYFDRELDAVAKPHRPIPSGRMRPRTALAGLVLGTAIGGALAVLLNWRMVLLVGVALLGGIAYNAALKSAGLVGNMVRGALTCFAFIFGAMAVATVPPLWLIVPALAFLLQDSASNLVGAMRDVEGDRSGACRTFPVRHGIGRSIAVVAFFTVAWAAVLVVLWIVRGSPVGAGLLLAVAVVLAASAIVLLGRHRRSLTPAVALRAHDVLLVERVVMASAVVALGLGGAVGGTLAAVAAAGTLVAARSRSRHEFGTGTPTAEPLIAQGVLDYVDAQLDRLTADRLWVLRGWDRRVRIDLTDLPLTVCLIASGGSLRRQDSSAADVADVRVTTTSETFSDVFLTGRTSPRRAFVTRAVRIDGTPRDLVQLHQLFLEFRRIAGAAEVRQAIPSGGARVTARDAALASEEPQLPPLVVLSDTTLRDGEQAPGIAFTPDEKVELAGRLIDLGVPLIEVGFPAVSAAEAEAVRRVVELDAPVVVQAIARPRADDIDRAVACGVQSVAIFVGTSDPHVSSKLRTTRTELLRTISDAVAHASAAGVQVVFAAEDATRTDPGFLLETYLAAAAAGADVLGIADTAGIATPWSFGHLVRSVAEATSLPVAVHCHDDLGLATANSLAALSAGASGVQCSVLGLGERSGNAALEQVVLALEVALRHDTGIDLTRLHEVAARVAEITGHPVPAGQPVVGAHAFTHESGLHLDGILADPATYEPYPPELVGRERSFVFGKHSGRDGVRQVLARNDVLLDDVELASLQAEVKRRGEARSGLDESGLTVLARELVERPTGSRA